ncbi:MAG TPA: prolyl oligopeptidase family serine peptidase [Vicinamibacterales bacterium]|nr:prolyl oligopeptidase family serine peptidase [Vicinamibacterales bacterium]
MRAARYSTFALIAVFALAAPRVETAAPQAATPLYQRFLSNANPLELVAARKVDRVAWTVYEEGKRNAYTAAAPAFTPVRLTNFMKDEGTDISQIRISDDGSTVVFSRGTVPNRDGWVANASADPDGAERAIWAVRTAGGPAWRVAEGTSPELAPDGSSVLFVKEGEIYRAKISPVKSPNPMDRGEKPFIRNWGMQSAPRWSPDGKKIAFVTNRQDHSFIAVYDMTTRAISYMSPGVDFDANPMWTADSRHIVFTRRPGLPFGQQGQQGGGGIGIPNGPAFNPNQGRGGRGQGAPDPAAQAAQQAAARIAGLTRATFRGGYTLSLWKADVATTEAEEVWHNEPSDRLITTINNPRLAADSVVFPLSVGGGRGGRGRGQQPAEDQAEPSGPVDEWDRYYAINIAARNSKPVLLTTTDGLIEDQTSVAISKDGKTFYYCTNAKDIDRRHIWAVPVAGGTPWQVTSGVGIETSPNPLASGRMLATMSADWKRPQSIGLWTLAGASTQTAQKWIFPTNAHLKNFPLDLHVEPTAVTTKAADGKEVYNQLFLPKDLKPGEKRPAIIFVHGGPVRQMLLGYHYMHFYHWSYGINQWLANEGYVVLSVNYRSGIGYGRSFRQAANTGGRGNSEYQDVLAGGKYLQSHPNVDPERVGIWGLSYGGVLTGQALARNSDIFKAGVDLAGVHLWGSSVDPESVSFKSSVIGAIDGWKSPVLLVHGDDDRNVAFQQTTGLVQLLRPRNVEYELIVFPDDTHESMLHSRWIYTLDRMQKFLAKHLGNGTRKITTEAGR